MAARDFLLPDLGEGLTEGEIVSWLVAVGDTVEIDQPVAEIETAKAVVEVPSPFEGTVTALHAEVGQEVEVGQPLISVDVVAEGAQPPAAEARPDQAAAGPEGEPGEAPRDAETGDMVPASSAAEDDDGASGSVLVGYGTGARKGRRRRGGAAAGPAGAAPAGGTPAARPEPGRPLAKPPVRKLAKDLGVDLADIPGSGPEGIVTREDVESFIEARAPADAAARDGEARRRAEEAAPPVAVPEAPSADLVERRPLKGMRKTIAARMTRSRSEIPEAVAWVDVDATELVEVREELNAMQERGWDAGARGDEPVKVTPLALIMRACVAGLKRFPELNSRLDPDAGEIVVQRFVNLGFATQTDAGLMVPVIHGADRMSTLDIAAELARLAAAARDRKVTPAELTGSTFSVTNFGSFGIDGGDPVINHPEAAILGVGRIADKPWVVDGALGVRKVMQLSVAFDHRICDGGEAGGFLRYVADLVESPTKLLAAL